ncbi:MULTISPECIES: sialidase family protein [Paenibacillus]|uniref:sialidase family protein n=1 Tax=Paenibacillus TaxID=44249 RepID=UPI0022B8B1A5|nr:sialidase family protein [Paenibacillus caseinilyticus]MCZ8519540.1 exo-alpha-sialidase [Paenibacillus caseinilyticus]
MTAKLQVIHPRKEYIFEDERPFASCHASTIVLLPDGGAVAAWFGGSKEGAGDVAIWAAHRSAQSGWTAPRQVAGEPGVPHWNPVLFRREDGTLLLYYKTGTRIEHWSTFVMESKDDGHTWSAPAVLVPGDRGGRGPVKNKPVRLADGTIAAPASLEPAWDAFVDLSPDGGRTWVRSDAVPMPADRSAFLGKGIIQPSLWESEPGCVHMLTRSTAGAVYRSDSADGGRSWCPAYATALPNNNSGLDLAKLADGTLALVCNPTRPEPGKLKGPRSPLVLLLSRDNGLSWEGETVIDEGEKQYSYPAIVAEGSRVHVTYTWRRERIAYWYADLLL